MTTPTLRDFAARIETLARKLGLDFYPVDFELVPNNFMMEIAVYGLPIRMRHWSFGVRYIHQLVRQHMGHSRIFEVMFPGDPCRAYMMDSNSLPENTLVTAHVLGHADFAKNNALFSHYMGMAGGQILEQSAARAHRIEQALIRHGQDKVEAVLDAALALEPHVDVNAALHRPPYLSHSAVVAEAPAGPFQQRYQKLPGVTPAEPAAPSRPVIPPHPESDLLWFIANYAPELDDWERDIFLAVREEAFYFYPVYACQIMNEGWASYWHARLLREADFLPPALYLDAIKSHSDVVRPFAGEHQLALQINPYHLGFSLWENIIERDGIEAARRICRDEDDFSFIRNYLDQEMIEKLDLFAYETHNDGETRVVSRDLNAVREAILGPKYNYGAPGIAVTQMHDDGGLTLTHDYKRDGRGLEFAQAERVLDYVVRVWRRPVALQTVDFRGIVRTLTAKPKPA